MRFDRLTHRLVDVGRERVKIARLLGEIDVPVAHRLELRFFVEVEDKIVCRRELVYAFKKGLVECRILEREVGAQRAAVQLLDEFRVLQKGFYLRAEQVVSALGAVIIKRLYAEIVARANQLVIFHIIDEQREHTAQLRYQPLAVFLPAVDEHLGVGARREAVSRLLKLTPQLHKVVYFAVINSNDALVLIINRLCAAVKVDYA